MEITPMIDVIFLLLTFFIYCQVMLRHVEVLPVSLTGVDTGESPEEAKVLAVTIDREGRLFLNNEWVDRGELIRRLEKISKQEEGSALYLAMEEGGLTDRGPILLDLIERIRAAGIGRFVIVGQPGNSSSGGQGVIR
jgi:biopolymer transport protein ExbD